MTIDLVFSWVGQLFAAGGGGAVVAYTLFRFFGKSWIENQLAKDLELAKAEISLLAARKMQLHEREYVVFPEVWAKLNAAFASLGKAVISFREIPDLSRMSDAEVKSWLDRSDLADDERRYFEGEADKTKAYNRILDWRSLIDANKDFIEFDNILQSNRIFLEPEIKEKLDHIGALLRAAWVAKKMDWDGHKMIDDSRSFLSEAYEKYDKEAKPIMKEIEELVQGRIFPDSQVEKGGKA